MKKTSIHILLMLAILTGLSSCDKDDDNQYPQLGDDPRNITQIIADNNQLSSFSSAMAEGDLDSLLGRTTTFSVFAPQNAAFEGVDLSAFSEEERENTWYNHVVSTVTADFSHSLSTGYLTTMATGPDGTNLSLFINMEETPIVNGEGSFVSGSFDIGATNGVLHVVDGLLVPPTVVDHAQANPEFSIFAEAIELSGLSDALSKTEATDTENADYPITLFTPTNTAFEALLAEFNGAFGWGTLADVPVEVLQEIVMYHAATGENSLSAEIPGTEQTSMQGGIFSIDAEGIISDASYSTATITIPDVQAVNGILHGVDKVLLPESVFQDLLGATMNLLERSEDRGFTSFLAAMEKVGLSTDLETEELTAFVPNNDAFTALFASIANFESLEDFDTPEELETLKALLNYHLHESSLMSSQFTDGGSISTLQGDEISIDLSGDMARLRPTYSDAIPSGIVTTNIGATNGIIHEINRILVPDALVAALGFPSNEGGQCEVGDENLVFFDWNGKDPYWGNVTAENNPSLSIDGGNYGRANFQTGTTGWTDLFWRNGNTLNGGDIVGTNLDAYSLKFDINVIEPISQGMFRIRFNDSDGVDAFYDWAPWTETGEPFTTDGWETIEIPLSVLGVPDFSLIDAELGMAFEGADVLLNFAIDNVRFDAPGCGGPDPVENTDTVFYNWDGLDPWWGNVVPENDAAISLDGSNYGRANFQTGGTGWTDLFWRNDASTFNGATIVGSNIDDYVLKFDIRTIEPISEGMFRIRFNASSGEDAMYDWQPWADTGEAFDTEGTWTTVTIPLSVIGQSDYSQVNAEFGMAFEGADVLLNFAIDNVRFEKK